MAILPMHHFGVLSTTRLVPLGILSAGATANNNVNIDVVGDLPTGCSSEYMISVTATNDNDVRTFSGYGQTTVDLGAPGEDVRTTLSGGNYTTTSGTSFASPATAGAVALMYSAPCASLAAIAHAPDPALAAQMVRDAIFNGVDPVSNLTTECVTGGRLNVKGALDEIINNCASGSCMPPFSPWCKRNYRYRSRHCMETALLPLTPLILASVLKVVQPLQLSILPPTLTI